MNLTQTRLLELVKYVGHLYTFSIQEDRPGDIDLLEKILKTFDGKNRRLPSVLAESLGVQCERYVLRCRWGGIVRICSDILEPRFTSDGQCCTFNYARWKDHFSSATENFIAPVLKSEIAGWDFGLSLLLDARAEDYFYQLLPMVGFKVVVYASTDFPDPPSGGAKEVLVEAGTESYINIGAYVFDSKQDVEKIDASKRVCRFKNELKSRFGGRYSFSDCIMDCRVRDIVQKCDCIPFFNPRPSGLGRWWGMSPIFEADASYPPDAFKEIPEGHLDCDCKPTCDNIDYTVSTGFGNLENKIISWDKARNALTPNPNHAVLHVYFGSPVVMKLEHDVQYYWYELMSNYGALCSIFLGLSLMSAIEVIYKFSRRLWRKSKKIEGIPVKVRPVNEKLISFISEKDPQIFCPQIDTREIGGAF
ncbi:sodium channel protein Nach-like isoform X2 [Diachasmimorpha longicaudata]|uniref:sodium channel protein Nach-like isoform X2 n=1 Tax=Diachasmimorpha longicaudata TaxID=58733 RepID=UPI0030B9012D